MLRAAPSGAGEVTEHLGGVELWRPAARCLVLSALKRSRKARTSDIRYDEKSVAKSCRIFRSASAVMVSEGLTPAAPGMRALSLT